MKFRGGILAFILCAIIVSLSFHGVVAQEVKKLTEVKKDAEKEPMEPGETVLVRVETNLGPFVMELYKDKAPITVENFLKYVETKFYDGTTFHRIIPNFMIQGGAFTAKMVKKETGKAIENEAKNGLKNLKYTAAMARTGEINSATSQFFINLNDNKFLDHGVRDYGYAVFGKVIEGSKVIDKIAAVKTGAKGSYNNVPAKPVIIKSIRVVTEEEPEE